MEWIKCSDKLPEIGIPVLVWDRLGSVKTKGSVKQVTRNTNSQKNFWYSIFEMEPRYTHWMVLPPPPKDNAT